MRKSFNRSSIALLCGVTAFVAGDRLAIGQAGSTGGTIGKTDKAISGGEEQNEPHTPTHQRVHGHLQRKNSAQQSETAVVGGSIKVTSATLGQNCGAPIGNVTEKVGAICNGRQTCELPGSRVNNPDPAYGCYKSFAAKWQCGHGAIRSNSVPAVAFETNVLTLSCN